MDNNNVSFRVPKDDLASALSWIARSLPSKPTQPILRGVLIKATNEGLELFGFDREVSTRVHLNADVSAPGTMLVPGKFLSDIVGTFPNEVLEVSYDGTHARLTCKNTKVDLNTMTIEDYPSLPEIPAVSGTVDPALFSEAIGQVATAAGRDETLPMLTGIRMEISGEEVVLAATDRFRLAVRTLEWTPANAEAKAELLIPARTLADTARTLDTHGNDPVELALGSGEEIAQDGLLGIVTESRQTTTRLLDAEFPKFRPLLPAEHSALASVEIGPLNDAIRRVSMVADRNAQIRMQFDDGGLTLSAGGSDMGTAEDSLPCSFVGQPLTIAFNPGYLKDGLGCIHTSRVVFGFTNPTRPAILIPEPENLPQANESGSFPTPETNFTYLLMPVRLPG